MRARISTPAGERILNTPLLGWGNLQNVLAASGAALELGVALDAVVAAAGQLKSADRRGVVHRLRGGIVLVDDSYNSSPSALRQALDVVAKEPRVARKVAVLGEMLELGDQTAALHEESGRYAASGGTPICWSR